MLYLSHLLLHFIKQWHTHTLGRTPLDERWARRRCLYLQNTQQIKETNIHAPSGIKTNDSSNRAAADNTLDCTATGIIIIIIIINTINYFGYFTFPKHYIKRLGTMFRNCLFY